MYVIRDYSKYLFKPDSLIVSIAQVLLLRGSLSTSAGSGDHPSSQNLIILVRLLRGDAV